MTNPIAPKNIATKDGDTTERPGFRSPKNTKSKAEKKGKKKK